MRRMYSEPWLKTRAECLTQDGKYIVSSDPDLNEETINKLVLTESDVVPEPYLYLLQPHKKEKVVWDTFHENTATGLAHVAMCIQENLNATLAELVTGYSVDRRIPFVVGAILIKDLMQVEGLHYYMRGHRMSRVMWTPRRATIAKPDLKPVRAATTAAELFEFLNSLGPDHDEVFERDASAPILSKRSETGVVPQI